MRAKEFIKEGGWDSTVTQGTIITPAVVRKALESIKRFIEDFNAYLLRKGIPPIRPGVPLGSSTYYEVDPEDKEYGDIDMQIIVPDFPATKGLTASQETTYWGKLVNEFVTNAKPSYIHSVASLGHIVVHAGPGKWVQVDLLFFQPHLEKWGRYRFTPEQGIKGLILGKLHSSLANVLNLSIQNQGVQYKLQNGVRAPYISTRKNYTLHTLTTDLDRYVLDIFNDEYKAQTGNDPRLAKVDPMLAKHPGLNFEHVNVADMVKSIKGLARSFGANGMYGKGNLVQYHNYKEFIARFLQEYERSIQKNLDSSKRDKAETPAAIERAKNELKVIRDGLQMVKNLFAK